MAKVIGKTPKQSTCIIQYNNNSNIDLANGVEFMNIDLFCIKLSI